MHAHVALSIAEGTAADIIVVDKSEIAGLVERYYLQPFELIDEDLAIEMSDNLIPSLRSANSATYALPADADIAVLWYRRDWFAAEELPPPQSWDDWLQTARHFQTPAVRERYDLGSASLAFAGGTRAEQATIFQLLPILWSADADVVSNNQVVLNSRATLRAVGFISDLVRKYRVASMDVVEFPPAGAVLA